MNKKQYWTRFTIIVALCGVVTTLEQKVAWSLTESIDAKILWQADGPINKDDYVRFYLSHPYLKDGKSSYPLNKRVACVTGDILKTVERDLYCNGEKIATALTHTSGGKPLDPFQWNGPIPDGKVFLLGDHVESFDSRYWGFRDVDELQRLVKLI